MDILLSGFDAAVDLMPDTYWLQHGGVDVRDFIIKNGSRIKMLHLKDMKRALDGPTFAEVGVGNINMKGILECATKLGISDFIVEQDQCDGDPLESARISYKNISEILGEG
jgi:sugar phosphate isomerase/epimerase